jgi:hypothetical protein
VTCFVQIFRIRYEVVTIFATKITRALTFKLSYEEGYALISKGYSRWSFDLDTRASVPFDKHFQQSLGIFIFQGLLLAIFKVRH